MRLKPESATYPNAVFCGEHFGVWETARTGIAGREKDGSRSKFADTIYDKKS